MTDSLSQRSFQDAEEHFANCLRKLVEERGQYLRISVGPVYMQFAPRGAKEVHCEAVANEYLPSELRLTEDKRSRLRELGFKGGDGNVWAGCPNFYRRWGVTDGATAHELARLALAILSDVYGCPKEKEILFELEL